MAQIARTCTSAETRKLEGPLRAEGASAKRVMVRDCMEGGAPDQ
jgi:hypothetical protein